MSMCPTCSVEGVPGALFCGSCGSRLVSNPVSGMPADHFVGQTLKGTYFIQQKLGSGGMGDVYKAVHLKLDAPVALKIVRRDLLGHAAMLHRFEREARAASKLRHPNVVAVTDFGQTEDGTLFMVMEYVAGTSLARVIADEAPVPERRVVHIGAQILSALAEAHANSILHRDLKPENIMIVSRRDEPDSVKVLDFGIAKILAAGGPASTLTQAGLVCGTPGYMSPEQLRGGDIDVRSDLFSVGVVLYEMLTHKLPFEVQTPMEMLHRHLSEPIPPPSQRSARPVSPMLEEIVMQALSPTREGRPESADAMRARLLGAALSSSRDARETQQRLPTEILRPRDSPPVTPPRTTSSPPRRTTSAPSRTAAPPRGTPASGTSASGVRTRVAPRGKSGEAERTRSSPTATRMSPGATRTAPTATATRTPPPATRTAMGIDGAAVSAEGAFDPALLKDIEAHLAPLLGPVAPYLLRKMAHEATTLEDLCQRVATFIRSSDDQKRFLAWARSELNISAGARRTRTATLATASAAAAWDPALLDRARRDLAVHLGPLARVIVRRVCGHARDVGELYELLALEIPNDIERELFRRHAPRPGSDPE